MQLIDDILNLIKTNTRIIIKWSSRSNYIKKKQLKMQIKQILLHLSGNDLISLIYDMLTKEDIDSISFRYVEALKNIATEINKLKQKKKHNFIRPLRLARFKLKEVKRLNFKVSKRLWTSCLNPNERCVGGKKSLDFKVVKQINEYLESKSTPAANRAIHKRIFGPVIKSVPTKKQNFSLKEVVPVSYLDRTLLESHSKFRPKISFSSFYKYKDKKFKKAHRETDCCEYCTNRKLIFGKIKSYTRENTKYDQNLEDNNQLLDFYNNLEKNNDSIDQKLQYKRIIGLINHKIELDFHKNIAKRQRCSYNTLRKDIEFLKKNLLIEYDYKQKLQIGLGPLNNSYYKQRTISYLSFGVYFVDNNQIVCYNYDILSDNKQQDANAVVRAFRFIRDQDSFKKIDKQNYTIFVDCGPHFRNKELIYYLFSELSTEIDSKLVSLNFFAPKHGKSQRDTHFSVVSDFLKKIQDSITTVEDACFHIQKEQETSNNVRDSTKFQTFALVLNPKEIEEVVINSRIIKHLKEYYNLRNINISNNGKIEAKLFSSIFSDIKIDENNFSGLIPVDSDITTIVRKLDFVKPKIKKIDFPLETDRLFNWTESRKRVENSLNLILQNNRNNKELINNDDKTEIKEISKPIFCNNLCFKCKSKVKYSINGVMLEQQANVLNELASHGHKKKIKIAKLKRFRNLAEAKLELINHLKAYHNL